MVWFNVFYNVLLWDDALVGADRPHLARLRPPHGARGTDPGCVRLSAGEDRATAVSKAVATATTMDRMPPKRVLVVDDQPAFRRVVRGLLIRRGHAVVGEADGLITALAALPAVRAGCRAARRVPGD